MASGIVLCHLGAGVINDHGKFSNLLEQTNESLTNQCKNSFLEPLEIVELCMQQLEVMD